MEKTYTIATDTIEKDETLKVIEVEETQTVSSEVDVRTELLEFKEQLPNVQNLSDFNIWNKKIQDFNEACLGAKLEMKLAEMTATVEIVDGVAELTITKPIVPEVEEEIIKEVTK